MGADGRGLLAWELFAAIMNDLEAWKLRGPVRTLRRDIAESDRGLGRWQPPRHLVIVAFRPDGLLAESEQHNPDGSVVRHVRSYDDGGRLTQELWWNGDVLTSRVLHARDAAGRPLSVIEVRADGNERELERCHYDELGRKTKVMQLVVPDVAPASCSADACGAVLFGVEGSDTAYGAPGATTSTTIYDGRGLPIEANFHDADGVLVRRVVFTRDTDGRPLREVVEWAVRHRCSTRERFSTACQPPIAPVSTN